MVLSEVVTYAFTLFNPYPPVRMYCRNTSIRVLFATVPQVVGSLIADR